MHDHPHPPYGSISVISFEVEAAWKGNCWADYLTVNGARYCGTDSPAGVVPNGSPIEWHADGAVPRRDGKSALETTHKIALLSTAAAAARLVRQRGGDSNWDTPTTCAQETEVGMSWRRRRPDEARGSDGGGLGE